METHRRGADGRRLFTAEFKQEQIARVARRWQTLRERGGRTAIAANEDVVPASELRAAQQRIKELERALGKKAMEIEILQAARYARADDRMVTAQIRTVIRTRASYGARRVRALVNREFATGYNLKRIQRLMELNGWKLPRATRRRTGRAHRGLIQRDVSNERWCSDVLEIACWNGELVQLGFVLDCHDREALAT